MKHLHLFGVLLMMTGIFITGCKNSTGPEDTSILYEDAAESISAAMGDQSGGAMESFADISMVAGDATVSSSFTKTNSENSVMTISSPPVYDAVTGWWSVTIDRSRSGIFIDASVQRVYQYQFQKNGVVQKNRITGTDTANTLKFKIVSGSGFFRSARVHNNLTQLKGAWTATKVDKDTVVINSDTTFVRSGVDSIITRNMIRTFTHTTTMTFNDVKGPRYRSSLVFSNWRDNFHQAVSGTVTGTYNATITFERGDAYKERNINKTFTITLGSGEGSLTINGGGKFGMNLHDGSRN